MVDELTVDALGDPEGRGTLAAAWSKYVHAAVLVQMILIVLRAKTMFYVSW